MPVHGVPTRLSQYACVPVDAHFLRALVDKVIYHFNMPSYQG